MNSLGGRTPAISGRRKARWLYASVFGLLSTVMHCAGQGTFIYDQQSSTETLLMEGGAAFGQQPLGQSFTPTLPSVGFVRLYIYDGVPGGGPGGVIYVNLRTDSITGPIVGTSDPVALPGGFVGFPDFYFPSPVAVSPGATYYFQPFIQTGGGFGINQSSYLYAGGTAYIDGLPAGLDHDFWFREGIVVVPEPSSTFLAVMGLGAFFLVRRLRLRR